MQPALKEHRAELRHLLAHGERDHGVFRGDAVKIGGHYNGHVLCCHFVHVFVQDDSAHEVEQPVYDREGALAIARDAENFYLLERFDPRRHACYSYEIYVLEDAQQRRGQLPKENLAAKKEEEESVRLGEAAVVRSLIILYRTPRIKFARSLFLLYTPLHSLRFLISP